MGRDGDERRTDRPLQTRGRVDRVRDDRVGRRKDSISYTNTGGRYDPVSDSWGAVSTGTNVPTARYWHTAVWTAPK
jgi:hypothetical protein